MTLNTYGITAASAISGWDKSKCSNSAGGTCRNIPVNMRIQNSSMTVYWTQTRCGKDSVSLDHLICFVFY